jgi:hypothetical protein
VCVCVGVNCMYVNGDLGTLGDLREVWKLKSNIEPCIHFIKYSSSFNICLSSLEDFLRKHPRLLS